MTANNYWRCRMRAPREHWADVVLEMIAEKL